MPKSGAELCEDLASKYSAAFAANPKKHIAYFKKRHLKMSG
jgi:hypothetical protein